MRLLAVKVFPIFSALQQRLLLLNSSFHSCGHLIAWPSLSQVSFITFSVKEIKKGKLCQYFSLIVAYKFLKVMMQKCITIPDSDPRVNFASSPSPSTLISLVIIAINNKINEHCWFKSCFPSAHYHDLGQLWTISFLFFSSMASFHRASMCQAGCQERKKYQQVLSSCGPWELQ